jgi:hypothetical protein
VHAISDEGGVLTEGIYCGWRVQITIRVHRVRCKCVQFELSSECVNSSSK